MRWIVGGPAPIVLLAVTAYILRFASSWWLLTSLGNRFDPHGFGVFGDAVLLSVLAVPLAGLLWWILRRRRAWRGLFAPASRPGWTVLSIALLLLLAAPTPNQMWAFLALPPSESWPAVLSASLWLGTAAFLRAVAVTGWR